MALRTGTEMPGFDGATEWLNDACPVTPQDLAGHVTLVHFWSVSCYICKNNMPMLKQWKQEFGKKGLRFVAVHMPRAENELDVAWVKRVAAEQGIDEPCAVDNDHEIGDRYETGGFWPYYLLFDAEGKLRGRAAGDAGLKGIEATLNRLMNAE